MMLICIGCISFPLFILYDMNQIKSNSKFFKPLFFVGSIILFSVTLKLSATVYDSDYSVAFLTVAVFYLLAGLNLLLLVYTLFFAIPFQEAYVEGSKQKICKEGVYALCRHPGVIFLAGFYLFLGLALGRPVMLLAGLCFTVLNLLYVWIQDTYIFPALFDGYEEYRKEAPFLIPDRDSVKKCKRDLSRRYGRK
ncbi:hypothetical protein C0033_11240 [Clostridium sp. chh4-2]|uniref:hypothetical protein n=1 Tax=Clostridium sp. chh4-2 TaxID=2067550 RepID=UPI000CCFAAC0|nr:hypothetical protein [Clostridium sp. chh4-2]PNV61816.1 hypothetical protein C0033_11240 [Clostridium sp. chh4-2]